MRRGARRGCVRVPYPSTEPGVSARSPSARPDLAHGRPRGASPPARGHALIGRNDRGMITTADDAETVVDHAREQGLGSVGMWSLARDSGTCPDAAAARPDCSGVAQDLDAYTAVLQGFA